MKKHLLVLTILFVTTALFAQKLNVRGIVTDEGNNELLVGASVVVKNTTSGTITDIDGIYQLALSKAITFLFLAMSAIQP